MEIALGPRRNILEGDRNGNHFFDRIEECIIPFHSSRKFCCSQSGNRITFRLTHIKSADRFESIYRDLNSFLHRLTVLINNGLARGISLFLFLLHLVGRRSQDADSLLALLYKTSHLLPAGERLTHGSVRSLQHDQDLIVHGISGKLRAEVQIIFVSGSGKDILYTLFQFGSHFFHLGLTSFRCSLRIKCALIVFSHVTCPPSQISCLLPLLSPSSGKACL